MIFSRSELLSAPPLKSFSRIFISMSVRRLRVIISSNSGSSTEDQCQLLSGRLNKIPTRKPLFDDLGGRVELLSVLPAVMFRISTCNFNKTSRLPALICVRVGGTPGHQNPLRGFQTPSSESAKLIPDPPTLRENPNSLHFSIIRLLDEKLLLFFWFHGG